MAVLLALLVAIGPVSRTLLEEPAVAISSLYDGRIDDETSEGYERYLSAIKFCKAGKIDESMKEIARAVALEPQNDQFLGYMSNVERILRHFTDGLTHAKRAIELNPKMPWYWGMAAINGDGALDLDAAVKYSKQILQSKDKTIDQFYLDSAREILDACIDVQAMPKSDWQDARDKALRTLDRRGFTVLWDPVGQFRSLPTYKITGPRIEGVQIALPLLVQGLSWIPDGFMAGIHMPIYLSGKLSTASYSDCGGASAGTPMSFGMNVEHFHTRKAIDAFCTHEFFHIMECRMDYQTIEAEWKNLNEPGFVYLGYENVGKADPKQKGFATSYGQVKGQEDRADLFMSLLRDPDRMAVQAKTDRFLAAKIEYLKRVTTATFPLLDDKFWEGASRGKFKTEPRTFDER